MESIVFDQSPLAEYLRDEGEYIPSDWVVPPESVRSCSNNSARSSRSPSPLPQFAPTGRPTVSSSFRSRIRRPLRVDIPGTPSLTSLRRRCSAVVASTLAPAGNAKFLEQFRYTIVASQLLSGHAIPGQHSDSGSGAAAIDVSASATQPPSKTGIVVSLIGALVVVLAVHWATRGGNVLTWRQNVVLAIGVVVLGLAGLVVIRQQSLEHRKDQALAEISVFVAIAHDLDGATAAAIGLVQEVELVSRGYRINVPLPPISRIDDRSQTRKCVRLRKALLSCFADVLRSCAQTTSAVKGFSDPLSLEKYHDIYDISDLDISDALRGFVAEDFEDLESLRTLKILAVRLATMRKLLLCAMLALDADDGDSRDFLSWTTAVEALRGLNRTTWESHEKLRAILGEEESFPAPPTPKVPLTPRRERWRAQMRKLSSLSSGIRGLQAKLQLLREESDRALDESTDPSEVGSDLVVQYDSIGADLGELMRAWEEGRVALASGIDRNEKRLSSMSTTLMSPTTSWSGLTTVEEGGGGTAEALRALMGEEAEEVEEESSSPAAEFGSSDPEAEEVYEAVALPVRRRSMLSREERMAKMRDERERREAARAVAEASRGMMKELEMVIKPRARFLRGKTGRIVSM